MIINPMIGLSMTALNIATDIPTNITSYEELAMWVDLVLKSTYPTATPVEGVGYIENACQAGVFYVNSEARHVFLGRVSLTVSPGYLAGGQKLWKYAQSLGNATVDNAFKANV
jgi:hypothetical protein